MGFRLMLLLAVVGADSLPAVAAVLGGGVVLSHPVPVRYDARTSARFPYAFKVFPSKRPNATTVIVLNGGPGATTMEHAPTAFTADGQPNFPLGALTNERFHVVYTDQRGTGQNRSPLLGDDAYSTDAIARDVLSIVKRLELRDYIVYGASYGTVQATKVARLATELGLPAPPGACA